MASNSPNGGARALLRTLCVLLILCAVLGGILAGYRYLRRPHKDLGAGGPPVAAYVAPTVEPTPTAEPEPTPIPCLLEQTEDAGQEYIDKIVFLGNSITYRMATEYTLPYTQVWVPETGTTSLANFFLSDIFYYPPEDPSAPRNVSLEEAASLRKPEYLVITLGTHDASTMEEEQFKSIYTDIIDTVRQASPDSRIICQSIFPVNDAVIDKDENIHNEDIAAANGWVMDVAAQTGCKYLNTYEILADENGCMKNEYAPWDGIHLSKEGFDAVFQYIRTHAWQ